MSSRLRDDCGGSRFLDLWGLLALCPLALVSSVLSSAPPDLSASWRWSVVNIGALAVTAVPVIVLRRGLRRCRRRPLPLTVVVTLGAAIGSVKGVTTSWLAVGADLIDNFGADLAGRTINTAVLGAVIIPAVAALLAAQDRWQGERDLLMVELVRRALHEDPRLEQMPYRRDLAVQVQHTRERLGELGGPAAGSALRRLVDEQLRPLSAEMLHATRGAPTVSRGLNLLRAGVTHGSWPTRTVAVSYAVSSWLLLNRHTGAGDAALLTAVITTMLLVLLHVGSAIRRRWPSASLAVMAVIVTAVAGSWGPVAQATVGVIDSLDHVGIPLASALWLSQLLIAFMVISAARQERNDIRGQLLSLLGPEGVRNAISHGIRTIDGREFAFFIHGHVQNQLLAAAERLERSTDEAERWATVRSVADLLDRATYAAPTDTPLTTRLRELSERWYGIADISLTAEPALDQLPPPTVERIVHLVVEAITNAVRHGAAHRIDVNLRPEHELVVVTVTDDGFGPRRGKPGIGSRYLDFVAPDAWVLQPAAQGGSQLIARIAP